MNLKKKISMYFFFFYLHVLFPVLKDVIILGLVKGIFYLYSF
jgi:hypothetical protein